MGKISEALKKIVEEREKYKETISQTVLSSSTDKKEKLPSKSPSKESYTKTLPLEEKLKLREKLFIARGQDSSGIDPRVVVYFDYSSPVSEQYRILRTNIKSTLRKLRTSSKAGMAKTIDSPHMFTITSALHNEGKTVTAVNLAVAFASDLESKVLLVDCDLRKGSVHQLLNLKCQPGLCEVLTRDFEWPVALRPTRVKNLFVIPRGKTPSNPSELLGSRKMRKTLEKLKAESFDYVIIDTPPLLPFTDARLLGVQTEGVIIVVQAQHTKAGIVKRAKEFLHQAHNKFLGFVLTQVGYYAPDFYGYYYYYYHNKNKD